MAGRGLDVAECNSHFPGGSSHSQHEFGGTEQLLDMAAAVEQLHTNVERGLKKLHECVDLLLSVERDMGDGMA